MGISATYIGVILLLLVLIGFVLSIIVTLSNTAGARIRHDMNRVLNSYDYVLNKKINEYKEYNTNRKNEKINLVKKFDEIERKEDKVNRKFSISSTFINKEASHRDSSLAVGYDIIRNEFRTFGVNVDEQIRIATNEVSVTSFDESLLRILESLNADSVYSLSLDSSEDQLNFFKHVLNEEDIKVLNDYLDKHKVDFSVIEFYDWLKTNSLDIPNNVVVRSGANINDAQYEPSICEGCQIIVGNKLYDYSISKRDIR